MLGHPVPDRELQLGGERERGERADRGSRAIPRAAAIGGRPPFETPSSRRPPLIASSTATTRTTFCSGSGTTEVPSLIREVRPASAPRNVNGDGSPPGK